LELEQEISEFFEAYCEGNEENQAVLANHIDTLIGMHVRCPELPCPYSHLEITIIQSTLILTHILGWGGSGHPRRVRE